MKSSHKTLADVLEALIRMGMGAEDCQRVRSAWLTLAKITIPRGTPTDHRHAIDLIVSLATTAKGGRREKDREMVQEYFDLKEAAKGEDE